jgi:hypothetical protein
MFQIGLSSGLMKCNATSKIRKQAAAANDSFAAVIEPDDIGCVVVASLAM